MPNYNFKNKKTGEEWEEFFTISGKEQFLKDNADIIQTPSTFNMVGGTGDRIKNDAGWKENYQGLQIKSSANTLCRTTW